MKPLGEVKLVQVVSPEKVVLIAFISPLIVCNPVKVFAEVNLAVVFNASCNPLVLKYLNHYYL